MDNLSRFVRDDNSGPPDDEDDDGIRTTPSTEAAINAALAAPSISLDGSDREFADANDSKHHSTTTSSLYRSAWQSATDGYGSENSESYVDAKSDAWSANSKKGDPSAGGEPQGHIRQRVLDQAATTASDNENISAIGPPEDPQQQRENFHAKSSMRLLRPFQNHDATWNRERIKLAREMMAELIGSFMLVWFGTGSIFAAIVTGSLQGLFQVASVWIIGVTMAIATTASISGAHLNPAISIAFALLRPGPTFGWSKVPFYILAQLLGAILASTFLYAMYYSQIRDFEVGSNQTDRATSDITEVPTARCFGMYYEHVTPVSTGQAFFAELLGTAMLAGVVFALTHPGNDTMKHNVYIPPFIGFTVGGLIAVIAPITQCGMNPARDFGPRIVAYLAGWTGVAFENTWVYIVAPIVGAPVGGLLADKVAYAWDDDPHTTATTHEE